MQKLKMVLILCLWSCTVSAQNDSLICFTKGQVQTFLITKVELNSCLDEYNAIVLDLSTLTKRNNTLMVDYTKMENKAVRRKKWAIIATATASIEVVLLFILLR